MSENHNSKLYHVYKTVLEMLNDRNYIILDHQLKMSLDEFRHLYRSSDSDQVSRDKLMIVAAHREVSDQHLFVYFPEVEKIKTDDIADFIQRAKSQNAKSAILVSQEKLSNIHMKKIEKSPELSIETFVEEELAVNITRHEFVPTHIPLKTHEKQELLERYKLKESQLPRIRKDDPVARYFGLKPQDVVKIIRKSETAGRYVTYRLVV